MNRLFLLLALLRKVVARPSVFLLLFLFLHVIATPVRAQESCDECKFLRCLKSTVERKQKLIAVYQGIQNFWGPHTQYDTGAPLAVIDFAALAEPKRSQWHDVVMKQLSEYATMEASRTAAVPAAEGCGYPAEGGEAETDVLSECSTKGLSGAMDMQPCKELAALVAAHEGMHASQCEERKKPQSKAWRYVYVDKQGKSHSVVRPPKILTPYGAAAGEIAAYQMEVASIKPIVEKLEKKCRKLSFKDVTIDCVIQTPQCRIRTGQKLSGTVCGDPTKATWTITPHYFAEGCGIPSSGTQGDKPFDNDCVLAGSDEEKRRAAIYANARGMGGGGWMCVYSDTPRPQITIRSFRLPTCVGSAEQKITVDAVVGEKCTDDSPAPTPVPMPPNS